MTSSTIEPLYVVDTHALIWFLLDDKKLGRRAKSIFQAAEQHQTLLVVSAIVLAELFYANAKFGWFADFGALFLDLSSKTYLRFVPFDPTHVLQFTTDAAVPEMHDRIIAGLASRLKAPLLTSDPLIRSSGVVTVVW